MQRLAGHWLALDASRKRSSGQGERGGDIVSAFIIRATLDEPDAALIVILDRRNRQARFE